MTRRVLVSMLAAAAVRLAAAQKTQDVLRGKLTQRGDAAFLATVDHKLVRVTGDNDSNKVLADARLAEMDLEAKGHFRNPAEFEVDGIETRALIVHKDDKVFRVSYYCDVCSIRTYSPGKCVCCQEETRLDLIDPSQE